MDGLKELKIIFVQYAIKEMRGISQKQVAYMEQAPDAAALLALRYSGKSLIGAPILKQRFLHGIISLV